MMNVTDSGNYCHREPVSHDRHHQEFHTTSRQRKRAAGVALGALVLTSGVTAALDSLNDYPAVISAGRLTINLADNSPYKSNRGENNLDISTDTGGNNEAYYCQVFAANSIKDDGTLVNPFLAETIPVRVEIDDIWDLVDMLNNPANQPIELLPLNTDNDNQNQN